MKTLPTFVTVLIGLLLETGWASSGSVPDFEQYRVILERRPFGEIAPSEEAPPPAPALTGSFAGQFDLRAIIDDGNNMRVGLLHKNEKRHFYINLGETVEGIELVSVDYSGESAVLRKGDETIVFNLRQPPDASVASESPADAPFQNLQRPDASDASTADPPRRPFFAEMRRRKSSRGDRTNPFSSRPDSVSQTNEVADDGAGTQPRPFGPFTPVSGTNVPGAFGKPLEIPQPSEDTTPFFQFSPTQSGMEAQGFGATIENLMPDDDSEVPLQPVSGPHPFQMKQQFSPSLLE